MRTHTRLRYQNGQLLEYNTAKFITTKISVEVKQVEKPMSEKET